MAVAESNMAEFKMAAIIKLGDNEWVKFFIVQNDWIQDDRIQDGRIQDGCHHQDESECMSEVFLSKLAESKLVDFKMAAIFKLSQNEWVKWFFLFKIAESKMAQFKMSAINRLIRLN